MRRCDEQSHKAEAEAYGTVNISFLVTCQAVFRLIRAVRTRKVEIANVQKSWRLNFGAKSSGQLFFSAFVISTFGRMRAILGLTN